MIWYLLLRWRLTNINDILDININDMNIHLWDWGVGEQDALLEVEALETMTRTNQRLPMIIFMMNLIISMVIVSLIIIMVILSMIITMVILGMMILSMIIIILRMVVMLIAVAGWFCVIRAGCWVFTDNIDDYKSNSSINDQARPESQRLWNAKARRTRGSLSLGSGSPAPPGSEDERIRL